MRRVYSSGQSCLNPCSNLDLRALESWEGVGGGLGLITCGSCIVSSVDYNFFLWLITCGSCIVSSVDYGFFLSSKFGCLLVLTWTLSLYDFSLSQTPAARWFFPPLDAACAKMATDLAPLPRFHHPIRKTYIYTCRKIEASPPRNPRRPGCESTPVECLRI